MGEIDEEDPFEYDFDSADLELTVALEEQLSSTQPTSLFPGLAQTQQTHTPRASVAIPDSSQPQREPQINAEANRLIEELRQKLYVQEHQNKALESKLIDSEEKIKMKELENLYWKKQAKGDQQSVQSKRAYPQEFPRTKSKIRKSSTHPESLAMPSSADIVNSMQSIHLSSQLTNPSIRQTSALLTQSPMLSTEPYTPPVKSETPNRTTFPREQPNPPSPSTSFSAEIKRTSCNAPKVQPHSKLNITMLKVFFADVVREHGNYQSANLNMLLVPSKIRMFAQLFSAKFVPTADACSANANERLKMVASDIKDLIARSQDAEFTISSLLIQFGLCLPICIEEKLYGIIHVIAKTLQALSSSLPIARDLLIKEIKFSLVNSNVYKLVQALSLYPFKTPPPMYHLVEENPEAASANSTEMIRIAEKYSTVAPAIADAFQYEKTPPQADATVKYVLSMLSSVGSLSVKPILLFLLAERPFLALLSPDTPIDILEKAITVIALNTRDRNWMAIEAQAADKKAPLFVTHLCHLLEIKQPGQSENWYSFSSRLLYLLGEICLMSLPENFQVPTKRAIFSTVIDFVVSGCEFKASGHSNKLIVAHKNLAKAGCAALLRIMKSNINKFEYDDKSTTQLRNLVAFYVDNNEDESHPAKGHLLAIEKMLDRM